MTKQIIINNMQNNYTLLISKCVTYYLSMTYENYNKKNDTFFLDATGALTVIYFPFHCYFYLDTSLGIQQGLLKMHKRVSLIVLFVERSVK